MDDTNPTSPPTEQEIRIALQKTEQFSGLVADSDPYRFFVSKADIALAGVILAFGLWAYGFLGALFAAAGMLIFKLDLERNKLKSELKALVSQSRARGEHILILDDLLRRLTGRTPRHLAGELERKLF